jgi:hypothetical protein
MEKHYSTFHERIIFMDENGMKNDNGWKFYQHLQQVLFCKKMNKKNKKFMLVYCELSQP